MPTQMLEARMHKMEMWLIWGVVFMVVFAVSTVVAAASYAVYERAALTHQIDRSNQNLSCYVRDQLDRSVVAIPANAYYKEHPDELADAIKAIGLQRTQAIDTWGVCLRPRPGG